MILFLLLYFLSTSYTSPLGPRTVNVELKTEIEFDKENSHASFLNFLKSIIDIMYRTFVNRDRQFEIRFRETLRNLGGVFKRFDDEDFKFILDVATEELRAYYADKKKYNPILYNSKLRMFVNSKLKEWSKHDEVLKLKITEMLESNNSTVVDTEFFSLLSQIFSMEDLAQFQGFLKSFNDFRKHKNKYKLYHVVKEAVDFALIKKYEDLSANDKRNLDRAITALFDKEDSYYDYNDYRKDLKSDFGEATPRNSSVRNIVKTVDMRDVFFRNGVEVSRTTAGYRPTCAMTTGLVHGAKDNLVASNVEVFVQKAGVKGDSRTGTVFY